MRKKDANVVKIFLTVAMVYHMSDFTSFNTLSYHFLW